MASKELLTRIIHKHDLEVNWKKATNFIPKQGELIIYDIDDNYFYERFKIGDGVTLVNNLPFYLESQLEFMMDKIQFLMDETMTINYENSLLTFSKGLNYNK